MWTVTLFSVVLFNFFFFESPGTFSTLAGHSRAEILAKRFLAFLHFPF